MKKYPISLTLVGLILAGFTLVISSLPTDTSTLFSGSGNCIQCHSATAGVLTNAAGRDVSPLFHWQSSMMGNAAYDPYWQAKVSSEVEENPHLQAIIEDKCATCHAPMGRKEAIYNGQLSFSFSELINDPLSLDGVSCTVCHQVSPDNLGTEESFSGHYIIEPIMTIYGPYANPFATAMVNNTGYTPVQGTHIESSALCATCHTLITPYVDQEGNVAGDFPEQMPYYEWLNSSYPSQQVSCQQCHLPRVNETMKISSVPTNLQNMRNPVYEHHFVGGNTLVNRMMKDNYTELGIASGIANMDSSYNYALKSLKESSIVTTADAGVEDGLVSVSVLLKNKTGHKIPTGFPSRRLWIHFTATDESGAVVFESGAYDVNGVILSQGTMEEHHDTIADENEVQIYEAVMGNTSDEVTTILLEASQYLKDNRIPPAGFISGQSYDSLIAITGKATADANFNRDSEGTEGSGSDRVTYVFQYSGNYLDYSIEICYQSIKPDFSNHISGSATAESERFNRMLNNENLSKLEVISNLEARFSLSGKMEIQIPDWNVFPNPTSGEVFIDGADGLPIEYSIYNLDGKRIQEGRSDNSSISFGKLAEGTYILNLKSLETEKAFRIVYREE